MFEYNRTAKYHETDQMGIIHHSNYIKWMEEARIEAMNQMGYPYRRFEEEGFISPVLAVNCEYKKSVCFDEKVKIKVYLKEIGRVKFTLGYEIYNLSQDNRLSADGSSIHCFLKKGGRPVLIDKEMSEFAAALQKMNV